MYRHCGHNYGWIHSIIPLSIREHLSTRISALLRICILVYRFNCLFHTLYWSGGRFGGGALGISWVLVVSKVTYILCMWLWNWCILLSAFFVCIWSIEFRTKNYVFTFATHIHTSTHPDQWICVDVQCCVTSPFRIRIRHQTAYKKPNSDETTIKNVV